VSGGAATANPAPAPAVAGTDSAALPVQTRAPVDNAPATGNAASSGADDFGKCSVPQIEFGAGFDGRRETSFQPVDKGVR